MTTHDEVIHMLSTTSPASLAGDAAAGDELERYRRDAAQFAATGRVAPTAQPIPVPPDDAALRILPDLRSNDAIVLYAFRYCLGRRTYAVSDCVRFLQQHWHTLRPRTQHLIHGEIREAIARNEAGDVIDVAMWHDVLRLPLVGVLIGPLPTIRRSEAVIGVDAVLALIDDVEAVYPPEVSSDAALLARLVCVQLRDRFQGIVGAVAAGGDA